MGDGVMPVWLSIPILNRCLVRHRQPAWWSPWGERVGSAHPHQMRCQGEVWIARRIMDELSGRVLNPLPPEPAPTEPVHTATCIACMSHQNRCDTSYHIVMDYDAIRHTHRMVRRSTAYCCVRPGCKYATWRGLPVARASSPRAGIIATAVRSWPWPLVRRRGLIATTRLRPGIAFTPDRLDDRNGHIQPPRDQQG